MVETRSGLAASTPWAELRNMPVFDGVVDVRHEGRRRTMLNARSGGDFIWRAVFDGRWEELDVDGVRTKANSYNLDEAGRPVSWVDIKMSAGQRIMVSVPAAR
jgi:hypothetical protein